MKIKVKCYAGYRGEETPTSFFLGDEEIFVEVMDRWLDPDHRYFKLIDKDSAVYILRHDVEGDFWELIFYRKKNMPAGISSGVCDKA